MLDGAGFDGGEEFIELGAVVAFAGGLGGEAAQERAGALEDVGGEGDVLWLGSRDGCDIGIHER